MPDAAAPSWRSIVIQALVLALVLALALLKAVSSETLAGALGMIVTAIFMGQNHRNSLAAVSTAAGTGASGRYAAVTVPMRPGVHERTTVQMEEVREPMVTGGAGKDRPTGPGEQPAVRGSYPGSYSIPGGGGAGRGGGGGGSEHRRASLLMDHEWMLPIAMIAVFFLAYAMAAGARLAKAATLFP